MGIESKPTWLNSRSKKIGDSLGVILPDDVLHRLDSAEGKPLFLVETTGRDYRLTPAGSDFEKTMAAAKDIMNRYDGTLRELAK